MTPKHDEVCWPSKDYRVQSTNKKKSTKPPRQRASRWRGDYFLHSTYYVIYCASLQPRDCAFGTRASPRHRASAGGAGHRGLSGRGGGRPGALVPVEAADCRLQKGGRLWCNTASWPPNLGRDCRWLAAGIELSEPSSPRSTHTHLLVACSSSTSFQYAVRWSSCYTSGMRPRMIESLTRNLRWRFGRRPISV